jgi:hypothetical protein
MIQLAIALDAEARKLRKRYEDEVESVQKDAGARIAQAQFQATGGTHYPDATFTLRLSYGQIRGYTEGGKKIPWATNYKGLYQKATGTSPYDLPARWIERKTALKADTPFNLVSTNDIIGGNSGSPLINKAGEVVGIIFDGNLGSLPNRFFYSEQRARAISVASQGILEALRAVYDAKELIAELKQGGVAPRAGMTVPARSGQP